MLQELKTSHVTLGSSPEKYTLSSKQYINKESNNESYRIHSYSPTSIRFGGDLPSYKSNYSSNYASKNYVNRPKSELSLGKLKKTSENHSNIILGEENSELISQAHSVHKNIPIPSSKLPFETEKNLKIHHFDIGNDEKFYKTTAQGYGLGGTFQVPDLREKSYKMKQSN